MNRGGKREGAGRKPVPKSELKRSFNVSLSEINIEWTASEYERIGSKRSQTVNSALDVARLASCQNEQ